MLTKVISGGQIGADIAGLRAAKRCGIETGGWIPKGFKTIMGDKPEYATEYGLIETDSDRYSLRTFRNVHDSDGTVRIARNFASPGEICTYKAITKYKKPHVDVSFPHDLGSMNAWFDSIAYTILKNWIMDANIQVLNVAGNARLDFEPIIEHFLVNVFSAVNGVKPLTNG